MKLSVIGYAIVLIAFLLPFFVVSCQQTELFTMSGLKLVTGGEADYSLGDQLSDSTKIAPNMPDKKSIPSQPLAIAIVAIAFLGIILALVLPRNAFYVPVLLSAAGIVCLFLLKGGILKAVASTDMGMKEGIDISKVFLVKTKIGFWLANLGFLAAALIAFIDKLNSQASIYQTQMQSNFRHVADAPTYQPDESNTQPLDWEPKADPENIPLQDPDN